MLRKIIKRILPSFIYNLLKKFNESYKINKFKKLSVNETFKKIYEDKIWTPDEEKKNFKYYSGLGSHEDEFIEEYLKKTKLFFQSFKKKPNVVELGCGDFEVSENLVNDTNSFIACDIYEDLINFNKKKYKNLNVDFKVLDITKDELPNGDVCIVRCVLQHLSNDLIINFIDKTKNKFKYLLITEHYPDKENFVANLNIITGPNIRLHADSAVDLSKKPFNLKFRKNKSFCKIYSKQLTGYLDTKLYEF